MRDLSLSGKGLGVLYPLLHPLLVEHEAEGATRRRARKRGMTNKKEKEEKQFVE